MMIIYKTTNLINGKIYIGQSKYVDPKYLGSGTKILLAIKKYGKNNFKKEILKIYVSSQKKLDIFESIFIKKFDSTNPKIGYNILKGTSNGFGNENPMSIPEVVAKNKKSRIKFFLTDKGVERKKSLSVAASSHFKEVWSDEEYKEIMSEGIRDRWGDSNFRDNMMESKLGFWKSKEGENKKLEMSENMKGMNSGASNPSFGKKWITDGKTNRYIKSSEVKPEDWRFGRTLKQK